MENEIISYSIPSCFLRFYDSEICKDTIRITDWHIHSEYEMVMLLSGTKTFFIHNETIKLHPGDIIFVGSKIPHKTLTPLGSSCILLQYQTDWMDKQKYEKFWVPEIIGKNAPFYRIYRNGEILTSELAQCIQRIQQEQSKQERYYDHFIRADMYRMLAILHRDGCLIDQEEYLKRLDKILPAIKYINEHYMEHISLTEISEVLNFHSVYCSRLFQQLLGCSFVQYLNLFRLHKAKLMMETSEKSITEISYDVGFASASYFIKTFKNVHGYSPRRYRSLYHRIENTPDK